MHQLPSPNHHINYLFLQVLLEWHFELHFFPDALHILTKWQAYFPHLDWPFRRTLDFVNFSVFRV
jgi:hypothetical protein